MISLNIQDEKSQSTAYFGGYEKSFIEKAGTKGAGDDKTEDGIFWMHIQSDDHWEVQLYDLKIGDKDIEIENNQIIIDSGASNNYFPSKQFKAVIEEIKLGKDCEWEKSDPTHKCKCEGEKDKTFPTIKLELGSMFLKHVFEL